jgi:hypothetical protein
MEKSDNDKLFEQGVFNQEEIYLNKKVREFFPVPEDECFDNPFIIAKHRIKSIREQNIPYKINQIISTDVGTTPPTKTYLGVAILTLRSDADRVVDKLMDKNKTQPVPIIKKVDKT